MFVPYNNAYIVVLRDEDGHEMLPIWVGKAEAGAISMALENVAPPRPMTHDFMKSILDAYEAKVISVVITDLNENTYFAKIHLMYQDSEYTVDARPSDAIALALRVDCPIYVNEEVIANSRTAIDDSQLEAIDDEDDFEESVFDDEDDADLDDEDSDWPDDFDDDVSSDYKM